MMVPRGTKQPRGTVPCAERGNYGDGLPNALKLKLPRQLSGRPRLLKRGAKESGHHPQPASQIATETRNNDVYAFSVSGASKAYTVNGLKKYTAVAGGYSSADED